jgi:hypothetical protein
MVIARTSGKPLPTTENTTGVKRCTWLESTNIARPQQALRETYYLPSNTS